MKIDPVPFPVVAPLVRRHAEDAAFYWSKLDASGNSPHLTLAALSRFSMILAAHLDGLAVAGAEGWAPAMAALGRWKQPGEAFVCAWLALQSRDAAQLDALLAQVRARPDELLRGVISAFGWVGHKQALDVIHTWSAPTSDPILQTAALRAAALLGTTAVASVAQPMALFLASPDEHVRAAAFRAAASAGTGLHESVLRAGLEDSCLAVRAEAAIALGLLSPGLAALEANAPVEAAEHLWQCVLAQVELHNAATGWYRKHTLRRLQRWVQFLAWLIPAGHANLQALIAVMPARVALRFIACHGEIAYLPHVVEQMRDLANARYAGWVWQTVTGVDLRASGLVLPEPQPGSDTPELGDSRLDADLGLPLPDADAIVRYPGAILASGQRYVQGKVLAPMRALSLLEDAVQAVRSIAVLYLLGLRPSEAGALPAPLSIRAPASRQIHAMGSLRNQFAHSGVRA